MAQSYWKRGNRKNAAKIKAAFESLLGYELDPNTNTFDNPNVVTIYDGNKKLLWSCEKDSAIAVSIMESRIFMELAIPKFKAGQVIVSKENTSIRYLILKAGIPNETGGFDYKLELISKDFKGVVMLISMDNVDCCGVPIEEFEKEAHVSGIPVSALGKLPVEPKYKVGQTVLFDGRVVTIHRIIEGYYLFADNGSRGCRIDQQDKFVELKFKVGDYLKHKTCDVTATVESIDVKGMCYRVHGYYPIPIVEQDDWDNLDNPKFNVGDLVVYRDLIGRVNEVTWQDHFGFAYKVGNVIDIHECDLQPADHRDVTRIVKNG